MLSKQYCIIGAGYLGCEFMRIKPFLRSCMIATTTKEEKTTYLQKLAASVFVTSLQESSKILSCCNDIDVICFCAGPKASSDYDNVFVEGTKILAKVAEKTTKPLHILYISSTYVYFGSSRAEEDAALTPASSKAKFLLARENEVLALGNSLVSSTVLRLGGIFGPGREIEKRATTFCGKVNGGSGLEPTNHIHVEDAARAMWHCLDNNLTGVYNVVCKSHPTRNELYGGLCAAKGLTPPLWDKSVAPSHGCSHVVSSAKIEHTGFIFLHPSLELEHFLDKKI